MIFAKPLLTLPKDFPQPTERFTDVPEDEDSVFGATDDEDCVTEEDDFGVIEDDETLTAIDDEEVSLTVDDDDFSEIAEDEFAAFFSDEAASDDEEISTTAEEIAFSAEDVASKVAEDEDSVKSSEDIAMSALPEEDSACNPCVTSCTAAETELSSQFQKARATPNKQNDLRCGFILSLLCRFINQPSFQPENNLSLIWGFFRGVKSIPLQFLQKYERKR